MYQYIKNIIFFENTNNPLNLRLLKQVNWEDVKKFIITGSIKILKEEFLI